VVKLYGVTVTSKVIAKNALNLSLVIIYLLNSEDFDSEYFDSEDDSDEESNNDSVEEFEDNAKENSREKSRKQYFSTLKGDCLEAIFRYDNKNTHQKVFLDLFSTIYN